MEMSFVHQPDPFEFYVYEYGGALRAKIEFDSTASPFKRERKHNWNFRIVLYAKADECNEYGMPLEQTKQKYLVAERSIIELMESKKVDCRFVARLTLAGMQELVFQAEGKLGFYVNAFPWIKTCGMEAELLESEDWAFFDEKIWPDDIFLRQVEERKKIMELLESGSPADGKGKIFFSFSGGNALLDLAEELKEDNFFPESSGDGILVLSRECILEPNEFFRLTQALTDFCKDLGVVFEGWEGNHSY